MILFFGYGDDPALTLAVQAAVDLGVEHAMVDQRSPAGTDLLLVQSGDGIGGGLELGGGRLPLSDVDAAYARPLSPLPDRDQRAGERGRALADLMVTWLDLTDALVVNRPSDMASNASKPFQAQLLAAAGFDVPETLVSSDPDEVRAFAARCDGVIFKSTSGIRSIVKRLDDGYLRRVERVRTLPTQFQALVRGVDIRVHVVGPDVFATSVVTEATDYRYAGRDGHEARLEATTVPDDVAQRCVEVAASMRLPLAGIDLRLTPEGRYVCFEVNPMPGYSYFEGHTGQPISRALVRHLAGKSGSDDPTTGRAG